MITRRILLSLGLIAVLLALPTASALSAPLPAVDDSYTVSLLHFNGPGTLQYDDESGKTWTVNGDAIIDASQKKFGFGSGIFDGAGDYITSADSDDWQLDGGSNSNEWTVDLWVRFNGDPGTNIVGLFQQRTDNNNYFGAQLNNNALQFVVQSGGSTTVNISNSWNPADATWYHVAIVKQGTTGYKVFVNGSQIGTTATDTNTIPNLTGNMNIGRYVSSTGLNRDLNGWIDEFRVSKGIARWTGNFTVASSEYQPATATPSNTATNTATATITSTPTATFTATNTATHTPTITLTPSYTPTGTLSPTSTATDTSTPTETLTPSTTPSPTPTGPTATNAVPTWYIEPTISYGEYAVNVVLLCLLGVIMLGGIVMFITIVSRNRRNNVR